MPSEIIFDYGPHGKPALRHSKDYGLASDLHFNVSHSGNIALVAITLDEPVGVDIEMVRPMNDIDRMIERFFSARERREYRSLSADAQLTGFFNCWTRKEAFIKATGEGLSRALDEFDVSMDPASPPRLLGIHNRTGTENDWSVYSFQPAKDYTAAAMLKRKVNQLSFYQMGR